MGKDKGFNFIVGLVGLFIIWKLYSSGFLHEIGFMALAQLEGDKEYMYGSGAKVYGDTILGVFAALLMDAIAIFGALTWMILTGLWDLILKGSVALKDLFETLRVYLKEMSKKDDKPEDPKPTPEPSPEPKPEPKPEPEKQEEVKKEDPIKLIIEVLKEMQAKVDFLENQLKTKVAVTPIVPEVKVEVHGDQNNE